VASSCSSGIANEQFTLCRHSNDERAVLPLVSRRGFRQIDRNLARGNEVAAVNTIHAVTSSTYKRQLKQRTAPV
jgi:hypothetical protein